MGKINISRTLWINQRLSTFLWAFIQEKLFNLVKSNELCGALTYPIPIFFVSVVALKTKSHIVSWKTSSLADTGECVWGWSSFKPPFSAVIIWPVWQFPRKYHLQDLSLFDLTQSSSRINSIFSRRAFVESNQRQLPEVVITVGANDRLIKNLKGKSSGNIQRSFENFWHIPANPEVPSYA